MNSFTEMQTFIVVVEAQGIMEAARRLGITKSVVSKRMQQLEKRLGVALLERGRRLGPTEAGRAFYHASVRLLSDLAEAEQTVQSTHQSLSGTLRLSAPMAFCLLYLAPLLSEFMTLHPGIKLDIETSDRFVNLYEENFDLAIRMGQLVDSELVAKVIAPNHHIICASPAYLAVRGTPSHPDELQYHDGLLYSLREPNSMWQLPTPEGIRSFRIQPRLRTDNGIQLRDTAIAGLGLAILPTFLAAEAIAQRQLVQVLKPFTPSGGQIATVYRQSKRASPKILALAKFLREKISDPPPWDQRIDAALSGFEK